MRTRTPRRGELRNNMRQSAPATKSPRYHYASRPFPGLLSHQVLDGNNNLPKLLTCFHVAMRFTDFLERKGLGDDRSEFSRSQMPGEELHSARKRFFISRKAESRQTSVVVNHISVERKVAHEGGPERIRNLRPFKRAIEDDPSAPGNRLGKSRKRISCDRIKD